MWKDGRIHARAIVFSFDEASLGMNVCGRREGGEERKNRHRHMLLLRKQKQRNLSTTCMTLVRETDARQLPVALLRCLRKSFFGHAPDWSEICNPCSFFVLFIQNHVLICSQFYFFIVVFCLRLLLGTTGFALCGVVDVLLL